METNIFEKFQGADLDRLADCIKAIRQAGLQVDKYTQAGVNPVSGNVWVWNEDWCGCVYCSIGFDVAWNHSCPECGTETNFDEYHEMQDFLSEYDGLCQDCHGKQ